jgi:hypothetical protein
LRALYGFLTLFLAFAIKSGDISTQLFGRTLHQTTALGIAIGSLGIGSLVATMIGARMSIRRPMLLQAVGILVVTATAIAAAMFYSLGFIILLGLITATASGLAKLAVDATIQEKIKETVRASAFAHSETLLMLAWVLGGAFGLIPFPGRVGIVLCAVGMAVAAARAVLLAFRLRGDNLRGVYNDPTEPTTVEVPQPNQPAPTLTMPLSDSPNATAPVKVKSRWGRRKNETGSAGGQASTEVLPRGDADQPTYHLYRPSTLDQNGNQSR